MEPDPSYADVALGRFTELLASRNAVPGGGSAAAVVGAIAASLLCMVARLTLGRERFAQFQETAGEVERTAERLRSELLRLADVDARAYAAYLAARRLPRDDDAAAAERTEALRLATLETVSVPLEIARAADAVAAAAARLAGASNPLAASDVGCAAGLAGAAVRAATLSVRINLPSLADDEPLRELAARGVDQLLVTAAQHERTTEELVTTMLA